jgi:23S rRNA pseudouridine2605 synthase
MSTEDEAEADGPRGERIAKFLARAGVASRRDAEKLIAEGLVRLGGKLVTSPATFVSQGDAIIVNGKPVAMPERTRLFRYHKPTGFVTTHRDPEGRPTVFANLPQGLPRLVSVGRLDLTSELELPANGWLRRYRVRVHGKVEERTLAALARGVTVDGVAYGPIDAGLDARMGTNAWLTVALREGKNREVRKVMAHLGLVVTRLIRTAYGPFQLGSLPRGAAEEVNAKVLREQLGLDAPKRGREAAAETEAPEAAETRPQRPPRARHAGPQTPRRGKG